MLRHASKPPCAAPINGCCGMLRLHMLGYWFGCGVCYRGRAGGGGGTSSGDNSGTPPNLEQGHQTWETSTPPDCQTLRPFLALDPQLTNILNDDQRLTPKRADVTDRRAADTSATISGYRRQRGCTRGRKCPKWRKKHSRENFGTELKNENFPLKLSPKSPPPV